MHQACVSALRSGLHKLGRLAQDPRGVSAVEFAMILPLMITLYLGSVEVSQAISIDRKVTLAARTVADLVARSKDKNMSETDIQNCLAAAEAVLAPYPASSSVLSIKVSEIDVDADGTAKYRWSRARTGSGHQTTDTPTIPNALKVANNKLIFSEVTYKYTPAVGYIITGSLNLSDKMYMNMRTVPYIDIQ